MSGSESSLYERLGGVYAISAVIDHFSDQLLKNEKVVNANPYLKEWHTQEFKVRLPGLKFLRTLWACSVTGGPFQYAGRPLGEAHLNFRIPPEVFDEVAEELERSLKHFHVPERERSEVLAAFNANKSGVTAGSILPTLKK
ncbi:MAG: group 1 truncated hemoglobin [Thaumarchaeota archaeon]|nr:group 1 truncated hemoglobin [Nitrososphaerota archaeon]